MGGDRVFRPGEDDGPLFTSAARAPEGGLSLTLEQYKELRATIAEALEMRQPPKRCAIVSPGLLKRLKDRLGVRIAAGEHRLDQARQRVGSIFGMAVLASPAMPEDKIVLEGLDSEGKPVVQIVEVGEDGDEEAKAE